MAAKRKWFTVFLGRDEVYRCLAHSDKEAIDEFHGCCGFDTLEEFCADKGLLFDDLCASADKRERR